MPGRRKFMTGRITVENQIGQWHFDPDGARLHGEGGERKLEDRAARTLSLLCERRGEIVPQKEILDAVWNGRAVSANSVAVVVRDLRRALDDDAGQPRFIETVAKRGYRLTAAVATPRRKLAWLAVVAAIAALALAASLWPRPSIALAVGSVRNETGQDAYEPLSRALTQVVIDQTAKLTGITVATPGAESRLRLDERLILWNGTPALALTAINPAGYVVWTGMAEGQEEVIAKLTAAKIGEFGRTVRHGAGSDE